MCVCLVSNGGAGEKLWKKIETKKKADALNGLHFIVLYFFSAFERRNILQSSSAEEAEYMLILLIKRNKQDRNERLYGLKKRQWNVSLCSYFSSKSPSNKLFLFCADFTERSSKQTQAESMALAPICIRCKELSAVNGFKLKIHIQNKYKNKPPTINSIQLIWQRVISSVICQHRHRYMYISKIYVVQQCCTICRTVSMLLCHPLDGI